MFNARTNYVFKDKYYIDSILILVTMIWGMKPVVIKIGLFNISAIQYNVWRLIFAAITSWIALLLSGKYVHVIKKDKMKILFISVCGFFIFQWFYGIGIGKTTAGNASLIMGTIPFTVAIISHIAGIERMNIIKVIGIIISFCGLIVVILGTDSTSLANDNILGSGYIFLGAFGYAIYMVFSKSLLKKYPPYQITAYAITITAILVILFSGFDININAMTPSLVFNLFYTGVFAMYVANYLWTWAIKRSSSTRVSLYNNVTPVFSMIFAALFLREGITIEQFGGIVIIFLGLYISIYKFKKFI